MRRLDDLETLEENKAARLKRAPERRLFPAGKDDHPRKPRPYQDLRWSRFKHFAAPEMFEVVSEHVLPFPQKLGGDDSTYAHHMKDARFTMPKPALLAKVVDMLDHVPMKDRNTKGDIYEYMHGKIATAGQNGVVRASVENAIRHGIPRNHRPRMPSRGRALAEQRPSRLVDPEDATRELVL